MDPSPSAQSRPPVPWLWPAAAVILLAAGLAYWLTGPGVTRVPPAIAEKGPMGDDISRMTPIAIGFTGTVDQPSIEAALSVSPAVDGDVAWKTEGDERLLLLQPRWPGYVRGTTYTVKINPGDPRQGALGEAVDFSFTTEGKLQVQNVIPAAGSAEVEADTEVLVQFNRPVAPLTALGQPAGGEVLRLNPPIAGKGKWLTSTSYVFRPDQGLAPSTRYTATVSRLVSDAQGGSLDTDYAWAFTTVLPAVGQVFPADGSLYVDPGTDVKVTFNQAMDRSLAESRFALLGPNNAGVPGAFAWPDDHTMVFHPAQPLSLATLYSARLSKGATAMGKPTAATSEDSRWGFTTVGLPSVDSTSPKQGDRQAQQFGVEIQFTNPMNTDSVEKAISVSPQPASGDLRFFWLSTQQSGKSGPGALPADQRLRVSFPTGPSSDYTVTIGPGALDRYGQPLRGAPFRLSYTTAPARPSVSILRSGSAGVFNAYTQPQVRVNAINVSRLDFQLFSLDLPTFISVDSKGSPTTPPGSLVRQWSLDVPNPPLNEIVTRDVSLQLQNSQALGPGYYLLTVGSPQVTNPALSQMPLLVTRTHLTLKRSDQVIMAWALDMASGQPVKDLSLTIYDNTGQKRVGGRTDQDGVMQIPLARPADNPSEQLYVAAEGPGTASLVSSQWSQGFYPSDFQISASYSRQPYDGYVYTDRPIYRPGQAVYYKGIVRADDDARYSIPSKVAFVIETLDSMGRLLDRQTVTPGEMGTFDGKLDLSAEASTGNYTINLWEEGSAPRQSLSGPDAPSKGRYVAPVASGSFQVAEYRKPEFEVTLATDRPEYVQGQTISTTLDSRYFFGQPVAGADVKWLVTARPYSFIWPGGPYYSFSDQDLIYGQERPPEFRVRREETGKTDAQGKLSMTLVGDVSTDPSSQVFVIGATVTDANQQQVSQSTEVIVHKGAFYIGLRPRSYVARAASPATVDIVTLDPQRNPVSGISMTVSIYQRKWLSVKQQDPDGSFTWRSVPQDTLVETRSTATGAGGKGSLDFTPSKGGVYRLVAETHDSAGNTIRSAAFLWVSSSDFVDWQVANNNRLEVRPDKDQYDPGDVAHVLVTSSFEGGIGLVTLERGSIISRRVMAFPTNSTVIDVPITSDHMPNVYISVALFKGTTPDNPVPSFRLGYAEFKLNTSSKLVNISIKPDKETTGPSQKETYAITTSDAQGKPVAAELSLALVDKAVLTLAEDRAPKPLQAFWSRRPLGVQTSAAYALSIDRLLQVTPRPGADGAKGGGGGGGGAAEEVRSLFPDTAYWNASLRTDAQGRATVSVDLPDSLTTWRLTAKAVTTDTQLGDGASDIVTTKALIIRPVTPRFLVTGDSVHLEASVHNFSDRAQQIQVTLQAQGMTMRDTGPRTVAVPPGEFRQVAWDTTANRADQAVLTFAARAESLSDSVELSLPVYSYVIPEVVATSGQVLDVPVTETVQLPGWVEKDRGELTLNLSPSLTAAMNYGLQQVDEYPYEDIGSTVSRLIPRLALSRAIGKLGLPDPLGIKDRLPRLVTDSVQRLYKCQVSDGGWSWNCSQPTPDFGPGPSGGLGSASSNPEITAYAVLGLAQARQDGFAVDAGVMKRSADFLRNWMGLGRDVARPLDANTRAFILYALAAAGQGNLGLTNALAQDRTSLGNYGKALLALTVMALTNNPEDLQIKALLSDLTSSAGASNTGANWQDDPGDRHTLNTSTRSTAMVLLALARISPSHPLVEGAVRWLMIARKEGHWATTQETAWSLLALTEYMAVSGELKADYAYQARVNGQVRLEKKVDPSSLAQAGQLVTPNRDLIPDHDNKVAISRTPGSAPGRLYYTMSLRYFPPGDNAEAANHGIGVSREYLPAAGGDNNIATAAAGDLVQVRVTVVAPSDLHYVVVEDYLPAGLEPVDTSLKTTSQATQLLLAQIRQALQPQKTQRWFYSNPFEHVEMRDNRVALFGAFLPKGVSQYVYLARATTPGEFRVMPAMASETYFPEVWGRTDGAVFTVKP
ncbi:MAG: Ig-like domain-containing protein [Dehalococcoidia bacterium]|nr:Ig-like domain-containing protein [Dehalococcoidia bacterium]